VLPGQVTAPIPIAIGTATVHTRKRLWPSKQKHYKQTNNMKRLIFLGFLLFIAMNNLKAAREITNLDIARWYLDSDIVLICSPYKIDTFFLKHHDSYTPDSLRLTYDLIREIYHINIDSVIKSCDDQHDLIESIYSQDFSINYAKKKQGENSCVFKVNELGDTIGVDTIRTTIMYNDDFSDNSYFRLENNKMHLVILSLTQHGYVIDYETELSDWILELIAEVKKKGQGYIDDFYKNAIKTN